MRTLPLLLSILNLTHAAVPRAKRQDPAAEYGFENGQPQSPVGKGGPILGGTDHQIDLDNKDNLGQQSTDNGVVPNLKWRFSDSHTRLPTGGWVREQVITDLPESTDIAAAQQHLQKGAIRELHWHRVAEWGFLYAGRITVSAVDADGRYQVSTLQPGDVWYFPKGIAHVIQGLDDENEYLLAFDEADFDAIGTTLMVDDWLLHTPLDVIVKNFGVSEEVFQGLLDLETDPYILNATVSDQDVTGGADTEVASGNNSFVYIARDHSTEPVPGGGGTFRIVDSTTFPIATTLAAAFVTLEPGGLRELHWHPNAQEWLYFHQGTARTFDFSAGDTAVFPHNSGHYIENTSPTETLEWVELYKSDAVQDISLAQWVGAHAGGDCGESYECFGEVCEGVEEVEAASVEGVEG